MSLYAQIHVRAPSVLSILYTVSFPRPPPFSVLWQPQGACCMQVAAARITSVLKGATLGLTGQRHSISKPHITVIMQHC